MHLTEKGKILFVHIPKNAGLSIVRAMKKKYPDTKKIAWEHAKLSDVKNKINIKKYKVVAIVRNPWARLVSLYHFIKEFKEEYDSRNGFTHSVKELKNIPFSDWLMSIGKKSHNIVTSDTPQFEWISINNKNKANLISKYEDINNPGSIIKKMFGELDVKHKSNHGPYWEYYTKESKKWVEEKFSKDIQEWRYFY